MKAKIIVNKNFKKGEIDDRIYGSFIEHLGRAVYTGIYEPGHETADDAGFRKDVLELVKETEVPIVRYPGGNFVSGYNWEDGTGPKELRPKKMELAWESIETNEVGIDEFQEWAKRAGAQIMMAVNLGTRGAEEARNLVEYCNLDTDTHYASLRRKNGFEKPFGIKTWCLGNEMDGPWQMGHLTAEEYARKAHETAKLMKLTDPSIELVICGSSFDDMPTYGTWELEVLKEAYESVDYISLHQYVNNLSGNTAEYLGRSVRNDNYIKSVAAMCDAVKAMRHSEKTLNISFDEWNVWFHSNGTKVEPWSIAPPLLEDIYTFEDALVAGCIMITFHNNCDRVKIACLAQLVNVIAPIMTEKGGPAWVQTIFYPFMLTSKNGRGRVLSTVIDCEKYSAGTMKDVPYIEASVIENDGELTVFAVNRSLEEDMELELSFENYKGLSLKDHTELYCDDLQAVNTKDSTPVAPVSVPVEANVCSEEGTFTVTLKKHSWNMLKFSGE